MSNYWGQVRGGQIKFNIDRPIKYVITHQIKYFLIYWFAKLLAKWENDTTIEDLKCFKSTNKYVL